MRPETQRKIEKIKKIGQILKGACAALVTVTGLAMILAVYRIIGGHGIGMSVLNVWTANSAIATAFGLSIQLPSSLLQRAMLAAIIALSFGLQMKAVLHLRRLFDFYSEGNVFTSSAAGQIRQLGITTMLFVVPNVLWAAAWFSLSLPRAAGAIHLELGWVGLGLVVTFISWFMDVAAELREENELTI